MAVARISTPRFFRNVAPAKRSQTPTSARLQTKPISQSNDQRYPLPLKPNRNFPTFQPLAEPQPSVPQPLMLLLSRKDNHMTQFPSIFSAYQTSEFDSLLTYPLDCSVAPFRAPARAILNISYENLSPRPHTHLIAFGIPRCQPDDEPSENL